MPDKILIIKHGALGDWILVTGAFKLIRERHPKAQLILLTASPYISLAKQSGWFDEIWADNRKGIFDSFKIIYKMRKTNFDYIYDMQRSQRTRLYYNFLKKSKLYWSGNIESGAGYFNDDLNKHILERIALQLQASHIMDFPEPDISWLKSDISHLKPNSPYALIIAGCAKHRPKKRWTAHGYAEIIEYLGQRGIQSVLIGTEEDRAIIDAIMAQSKKIKPINLINKTTFAELAELARSARFSIGSDTGSMHIVAGTGTPSLTLFCLNESNAKLNRPWGKNSRAIETVDLETLAASEVIKTMSNFL